MVCESAGMQSARIRDAYDEISIWYLCSFAGDEADAALLGERIDMLVEEQLDATGKETSSETLAERCCVGTVEKLGSALDDGDLLVLWDE